MKTVYEVTQECEFTGKVSVVYKGGNKREALSAKRNHDNTTFRSYYAAR